LFVGDGERLLDEHRLARLQRLADERRVGTVTSDDKNYIDGFVVQDGPDAGTRVVEGELPLCVDGRQ
jgi:hypothetical protein